MLNCIYNKSGEMRVVSDDERLLLVGKGVWFDDPKCTRPKPKAEVELLDEIAQTQAKIDALEQKFEEKSHEDGQKVKKRGRPRKTTESS